MGNKFNSQREQIAAAYTTVGAWLEASEQYRNLRAQILREHRLAGRKLALNALNLPHTQPRWTILPLPVSADVMLAARARYTRTAKLRNKFDAFLKLLTEGGARAYRDFTAFSTPQFANNLRARKQAEIAGEFIVKLASEGERIGFTADAINLSELQCKEPTPKLQDALHERFDLAGLLSIVDAGELENPQDKNMPAPSNLESENSPQERKQQPKKFNAINIAADELSDLPQIIQRLDTLAAKISEYRNKCIHLATQIREAAALEILRTTDLEQLLILNWQPLKLTPLKNAGITNVAQLLDGSVKLNKLSGIGEKTSHAIITAANSLYRETIAQTPARINAQNPSPLAADLIRALLDWEYVQNWLGKENRSVLAFAAALKPRIHQLSFGAERVVIVGRSRDAKDFQDYLQCARKLAMQDQDLETEISKQIAVQNNIWEEFTSRAAFFYAQMAEIGIPTSDTKRTAGQLPAQVVAEVQKTKLNTNQLTLPLRGYQNFGAKFILTQEKVILGDEMGLGKTLEALAAAAHLCEAEKAHIIVICPAAVVTNWIREIESKTRLSAYRLHGNARHINTQKWLDLGGIAVTTYESLGWFLEWLTTSAPADLTLSYVITDEAHYVKNEDAKRSKRTAYLLNRARSAVLLTGTPMENNPDEFRTLIRYIHPHLANMQALRPIEFRQRVAPIYLRRTQEDVLDELPKLIETEEWIEFSPTDLQIYENAVRDGNFMAMRQAAMISPDSAKIARIKEILTQAKENGRKAIIYSYFLQPLQILQKCLTETDHSANSPISFSVPEEKSEKLHTTHQKPQLIGPLTGSITPDKRQEMVDQLGSAPAGSVLLAQINAGGVGLNIQAANIVIICEPQLKPTIEWQAIARSHRMGQTSTVYVYRLLSERSVDTQLHRRLAQKAMLFDEFADISETANAQAAANTLTDSAQETHTQTQSIFSPAKNTQNTNTLPADSNDELKAPQKVFSDGVSANKNTKQQDTIREIIEFEKARLSSAALRNPQ